MAVPQRHDDLPGQMPPREQAVPSLFSDFDLYLVGQGKHYHLKERLCRNWHLIDHEIVARVARELGIPEQKAEVHDEYAKGFIARVVSQFVSPVPTAASNVVQVVPEDQTVENRYQETLRLVVETAARR